MLRKLSIFCCLIALAGCATAPVAQGPRVVVAEGKDARLTEGSQKKMVIGLDYAEYHQPFSLNRIPEKPKLNLIFGVIKTGICPVTYRPTIVRINGTPVAEIDFRKFKPGELRHLTIDIGPSYLKIGENLLQIRTGWCQYSIDVMRLEEITLFQR